MPAAGSGSVGKDERRAASARAAGGRDTRMRERRSLGDLQRTKNPFESRELGRSTGAAEQKAGGGRGSAGASARSKGKTAAAPKPGRKKSPDAQIARKMDAFTRSIEARMTRLETLSESVLSQSMQRDSSSSFSMQREASPSSFFPQGLDGMGSPLHGRSSLGAHGSPPSRHESFRSSPQTARLALQAATNGRSPSGSLGGSPSKSALLSPREMEGIIRNTMRQKLKDFIGSSKA